MQDFVMEKPKNIVMFWSFLVTFWGFPFGWHFVVGILPS